MSRVTLYLYITIFMYYVYALIMSRRVRFQDVDPNSIPHGFREMRTFWMAFFTMWNFFMQMIFLGCAILDEAVRTKYISLSDDFHKRVGQTRNFIYTTIMFPSSLLVMTVFWSIWHYDRELIFPRIIDTFYPSWLNHTLHSFIAVPLVIELFTEKEFRFIKMEKAFVVLLGYSTVYKILYLFVYFNYGVWLYPIYNALTWPQRIGFILGQFLLLTIYLKLGIELQKRKIVQKTHQSRKKTC